MVNFFLGLVLESISLNIRLVFSRGLFMCEIYSKILGTGEFVYFSREGIHSLHPILMGSIA